MSARKNHAIAIFSLALITFWVFHYFFTAEPGAVVSFKFSDLELEYYPWRVFASEAFRQGHLPLWNPYSYVGSPFFANPETALLYPVNWLHLILPVATAINFIVAFHIFLTGLNFYVWMIFRKIHPFAAVTSAACVMLSGPVFSHVWAGHMSNLASMAWAPLIFLAVDGLFTPQQKRFCLLGVLSVGLQIFAGHTQYLYFTGLIALFYFLLQVASAKDRLRPAIAFAIMYGWAIAISAVQLLTTASALLESTRSAAMTYQAVSIFSFPPENILTFFVPGFFGNMGTLAYWGRNFYWEMCAFLSITALILAGLGFWVADKKMKWAGGVTLALAVILAFGQHMPLHYLFYAAVPFFDHFRGSSKFLFQATLFIALFFARGLDDILKREVSHKRLAKTAIGFAAALAFISIAVSQNWMSFVRWVLSSGEPVIGARANAPDFLAQTSAFAVKETVFAVVTLLVLAALLWFQTRNRWLKYAIGALAVFELLIFSTHAAPMFEPATPQDMQIQSLMKPFAKDRILWGYFGNAPMKFGLYNLSGYSSIEPQRVTSLLQLAMHGKDLPMTEDDFYSAKAAMRLTRTRVVLAAQRNLINSDPLRRFEFVHNWKVVPDAAAAIADVAKIGFDPGQTVILESEPAISPDSQGDSPEVKIEHETSDEMQLSFDLKSPAILLVTDAYADGWRARALAGSAQTNYQVMPADGVIRAIPVTAGHQHFIMEYAPAAFELGKWISLTALAAFLAASFMTFRKQKKDPSF